LGTGCSSFIGAGRIGEIDLWRLAHGSELVAGTNAGTEIELLQSCNFLHLRFALNEQDIRKYNQFA